MKLRIAKKITRDYGNKVHKKGIYRKKHKRNITRYNKDQVRIAEEKLWRLVQRIPDEPFNPREPLTPSEAKFRDSLFKAMSGDNSVRTLVNLGNLKDHDFNIPF